MNNSRSFEDDVDDGPRERLLVGDGARQRRQGRPFMGGDVLLVARPSVTSRSSVKYTDPDGRLFYTPGRALRVKILKSSEVRNWARAAHFA